MSKIIDPVLLVIGIVVLALIYFYVVGSRKEKQDEAAEKAKIELTKTLTSLTKADYDFFVANDVELPQEVHDHFNPKPIRQTHKVVPAGELEYADRFGGTYKSWINTEKIRG